MPKSWTTDTLPEPTDERVKLVPMPAERMVVIRFSGTANDELIAAKTVELRKYALPFLRRNELMLELAKQGFFDADLRATSCDNFPAGASLSVTVAFAGDGEREYAYGPKSKVSTFLTPSWTGPRAKAGSLSP